MTHGRKVFCIVGWLVGGLFVFLLVLTASIHFSQHRLRVKSEQLLSDLHSLELRRSTYDDARRVLNRWQDYVHQQGPCQRHWCDVQISLGDMVWRHQEFFVNHLKLLRVYGLLGGRSALITGSIRVRKNIVWGKGIAAYLEGRCEKDGAGDVYCLELIGRAQTDSVPVGAAHPEYQIGGPGACTFCDEIYVLFTPYADPADVNRLMDVGFSCITKWSPCQTKAEILPAAWTQLLRDRDVAELSAARHCPTELVRAMSRESGSVKIGVVTKTAGSAGKGPVTLRLDSELKSPNWPPPSFWDLPYPSSVGEYEFSRGLPPVIRPGARYFIFSHPDCPILAVTPENLELVQQGLAEDWADHPVPSLLPRLDPPVMKDSLYP